MKMIFARPAFLITFALAGVATLPVFAGPVPISTLFSTGTGSEQSPDLHYSILQDPMGNPGAAYVTDSSGFPFGSWFLNDTSSKWISPQGSYTGGGGDATGQFIYRTNFDLSSYDPSTASITMEIATDNSISSVELNGVSTRFSYASFFQFSDPLTISSGFFSGNNTLDFVTANGTGPGALRVLITGMAEAATATPEPASFLLLGSALFVVGTVRRRKA